MAGPLLGISSSLNQMLYKNNNMLSTKILQPLNEYLKLPHERDKVLIDPYTLERIIQEGPSKDILHPEWCHRWFYSSLLVLALFPFSVT